MRQKREWAWVRPKKDGDYIAHPPTYQLVVGRAWGHESRVIAEYEDMHEAFRMQEFFNNVNQVED